MIESLKEESYAKNEIVGCVTFVAESVLKYRGLVANANRSTFTTDIFSYQYACYECMKSDSYAKQ